MQKDSTKRFSDRVNDYIKYRPSYPPEVLKILKSQFGLLPSHRVVDIGSGTGISAELFLKNGNPVYAVEPNEAMRTSAEKLLTDYPQFHSVNGTAEATTLPGQWADFIVAAQAFHWFDPIPTKAEFKRILKDHGCVIILVNDRKTSGTQFAIDYEKLLNDFGTDYQEVKSKNVSEKRHQEFLGNFQLFQFSNQQSFDFDGLLGRVKSSSYAPKEGHANFLPMQERLKEIFAQNQQNGQVTMDYVTQLYCSQLTTDNSD